MNRPAWPSLRAAPAAALLAVCLTAPAWAATEPFAELLEGSLKDRKGVVVYVKGRPCPAA